MLAENEGATALQGYGDYLGEDNMIGHALWHQLGLGHAMNSDVVGNSVGRMSLRTYFWRRVRWIRVRLANRDGPSAQFANLADQKVHGLVGDLR